MEDVFLHIIWRKQEDEELQLKKLDLSYSNNLDQVDDQLLARALAKIQTVNLNTSGISMAQVGILKEKHEKICQTIQTEV